MKERAGKSRREQERAGGRGLRQRSARFARVISVFLLVNATSCTVRTVEVVPPEDVGGTCETALENLSKLPDACGIDVTTFPADCADRARVYSSIPGERYPVGCLTAAKSCPEAQACR